MKILVVSAHPDDEALGCGGTLLKHAAAGDSIDWLITTSAHEGQAWSAEWREKRKLEILKVKETLNINNVYELNHPTATLVDSMMPEMIGEVSNVMRECAPEVIYIMNRSDAHSDHYFTFKSVMACTKSFRYPSIKTILMYECLSETEFGIALPENVFIPTWFVDVSDFMESKIELMKIYDSELKQHPFPRSERNIRALGTYRGATMGVEYAEAFQLLKHYS